MVFFPEQGLIIQSLLAYRQHNLSIIYRSFETILHNLEAEADTSQEQPLHAKCSCTENIL